MSYLVKQIVKNRLISAIKNRDKNTFNQWVSIISLADGDGAVQRNFSVLLDDNKSIPQVILELSDNYYQSYKKHKWYQFWSFRSWNFLASQDLTLGLIHIAQEYQSLEDRPNLRWYQSFISSVVYFFSIKWNVSNQEPFLPEKITAEMVKHIVTEEKAAENTMPAIREKYSPEQTIKKLFKTNFSIAPLSIPARKTPEGPTIPTTDWIKSSRLNHQMNQNQQQQQTTEQSQQITLNLANKAQQDARLNTLVDDSALTSVTNPEYQKHDLTLTLEWISYVLRKIISIENDETKDIDFHISERARTVLVQGQGLVRVYRDGYDDIPDIDLTDLPLGFFLDKSFQKNQISYILKFSESFRDYQIKNVAGYQLKLDPFGYARSTSVSKWQRMYEQRKSKPSSSKSSGTMDQIMDTLRKSEEFDAKESQELDLAGSLEKLTEALKSKNLQLTEKQLNFLTEKHTKFFKKENSSYDCLSTRGIEGREFTRYVIDILNNSDKQVFIKLLDLWIKLGESNHSIERVKKWQTERERHVNHFTFSFNLFDNIIRSYLRNATDPKEYSTQTSFRNMERLLQLDNKELSHFWMLTNWVGLCHAMPSGEHQLFNEAASAFFYFIDYLKSNDIELPNENMQLNFVFGVNQLRALLNAFSLSKNPRLQAKYSICKFPLNDVSRPVSLFKAGYCLVMHQMMYSKKDDSKFEDFFQTQNAQDHWLINREQFESIDATRNPELLQAVYLRYLSYNVSAEDMDLAIQEWNQRIKDNDSKQVVQYWHELKTIALSYPARMGKKSQPETVLIRDEIKQELRNAKQYAVEDLDRLPLNKEDKNSIKDVIEQLNNLAEEYSNLEGRELEELAKKAKENLKIGNTNLVYVLALLREINARATGHMEWLRIEQITVIYLALTKNRFFQVETSEGKTLIIQMIAILQILQGKKVDIITHNEPLAEDSISTIVPYLHLFGLKAASKKSPPAEITLADVYYSDASAAVINNLFAELALKENLPERKADVVLIDEADNIALDIHATTSMQISEASEEIEATQKQEAFLFALNAGVELLFKALQANPQMTKDEQRDLIKHQLKTVEFYENHCKNNEKHLDFWISASFTALHPSAGKKKGTDYVVQLIATNKDDKPKSAVQIAHKDTTGRIDKIAHWSAGIHQCVAAKEKALDNAVMIPPFTRILAEGDVIELFNQYPQRSAFTGSMGNDLERQKLQELLAVDATHIMPRAKRPPPEKNVAWPIVSVNESQTSIVYSRGYSFPPQLTDGKQKHFERLLSALNNAREQGYSSLIFFNTIEECHEFCQVIQENGVAISKIQILDDLNPDTEEDQTQQQSLRPTEATVITRANEPGMVTITTAAGSRGTNFKRITVGIIAKPGLKRFLEQKKGRLGRDIELGVTYEIYNTEDLILPTEQQIIESPELSADFRFFVAPWEKQKQEQQLKSIEMRQPVSAYKKQKTKELKQLIHEFPEQKNALLNKFAEFNHIFELVWNTSVSTETNTQHMDKEWEHLFSNFPYNKLVKK